MMPITEIRAFQPPTPQAPPDWRTQLGQIVVEVRVNEPPWFGLGVGGGGAAAIHVVRTVLRDRLLGRDPADVEALHEDLVAHTAFYGRKGLAVMALSGVDLALWDLRGKAAGVPVTRQLNGHAQLDRPLPTYVTVFDERGAEAAIAEGHPAIKLHVERFGDRPRGPEIGSFVERVRGQLGADARIMIDAFGRWDLASTLRVADAVAPYRVEWLEEPLLPHDLAGYEQLARSCPIPIAGGEHEYLVEGFSALIARGLHQILQPDVNWCGGMTTLVEIYRMAAAAGVRVCPHRGSEPFALPAIAALDPDPLAESPRAWFPYERGGPRIEGGKVLPSAEPGFGVSITAPD